MLRVSFERIKPESLQRLRTWLKELQARESEVRETFTREGVRHEVAYLIETSDGPLLAYAMEADDHERARTAYRESRLPIDAQHRAIMAEVSAGKVEPEVLYDASAAG